MSKVCYNFLSNRDRKKKMYFVNMKFCCASNANIKNVKITLKKFKEIFVKKIQICLKRKDF